MRNVSGVSSVPSSPSRHSLSITPPDEGSRAGCRRERSGEHYTGTLSEFQSAEDAEEFGEDYDPPYPAVNVMIEVFDKIAVAFFTLEYIIRFACCPRKLKFFFRLLQPSPLRVI